MFQKDFNLLSLRFYFFQSICMYFTVERAGACASMVFIIIISLDFIWNQTMNSIQIETCTERYKRVEPKSKDKFNLHKSSKNTLIHRPALQVLFKLKIILIIYFVFCFYLAFWYFSVEHDNFQCVFTVVRWA